MIGETGQSIATADTAHRRRCCADRNLSSQITWLGALAHLGTLFAYVWFKGGLISVYEMNQRKETEMTKQIYEKLVPVVVYATIFISLAYSFHAAAVGAFT